MSTSVEEDICFDVDGTVTHGTLRVPAYREGQPLAAALLLPGSGPVDRNGDVPGLSLTPRTQALIAKVLARLGIMSLRFDKYFTGRTGAGAYAADPGRIDLDAFIRQAAAAYRVLGARQATAQLSAAVAAGTLDPTVATTNASGIRHVIGEFRAGRPVDTSGLLPDVVRRLRPGLLVAENARYVRQGDAVHPVAAAAKVAPGTRVLVTAGTRDASIPVSAIKLLAVVLAGVGTTGPGLQVLEGVDHFLHQSGTPRNEPVLAPAVVAALTEWAGPYAAYGA